MSNNKPNGRGGKVRIVIAVILILFDYNGIKNSIKVGFTIQGTILMIVLAVIAILLLASVIRTRLYADSKYDDTVHYDSYYNESEFDYMLDQIKREGNKVTYANRNTGTISYRDQNNEVRSVSVYRGYNSHWKDTRDSNK